MAATSTSTPRVNGRRAEAARNDSRILAAAREVFVADPSAPIANVAERAGVGIAALYRRYSSKQDLLRKLCLDGLEQFVAVAEAAWADTGDPWQSFMTFMRQIVAADTHSLTLRLAGTFQPTEELLAPSGKAQDLSERIFARTKAAGAIRAAVEVDDVAFILEQVASVRLSDPERTRQLRERYLALHLSAVHLQSAEPLPGPAPSWQDVSGRWRY